MVAASLMEISIRIPLITGLVLVTVTVFSVMLSLPAESTSDTIVHSVTQNQPRSPSPTESLPENQSRPRVLSHRVSKYWHIFWKRAEETFHFIWQSPKVGYLILTFLASNAFPESEGIFLQFVSTQLGWTLSQVTFSSQVSRFTTNSPRRLNFSQLAF
jgi:hypothetical protein